MNPMKKKDRLEGRIFAFAKSAGRQYLRQQNIVLNVAIKSPVNNGLLKFKEFKTKNDRQSRTSSIGRNLSYIPDGYFVFGKIKLKQKSSERVQRRWKKLNRNMIDSLAKVGGFG